MVCRFFILLVNTEESLLYPICYRVVGAFLCWVNPRLWHAEWRWRGQHPPPLRVWEKLHRYCRAHGPYPLLNALLISFRFGSDPVGKEKQSGLHASGRNLGPQASGVSARATVAESFQSNVPSCRRIGSNHVSSCRRTCSRHVSPCRGSCTHSIASRRTGRSCKAPINWKPFLSQRGATGPVQSYVP